MKLLGLDVETTGLDPNKEDIIEIGAVLWCTVNNKPVVMESMLVETNKGISSFITDLTGITSQDILDYGLSKDEVADRIQPLLYDADAFVAHNHSFDKNFLHSYFKKHNLEGCLSHFSKPWIDTQTDLPKSAYGKSKALTYVAADNGFLNPFAHRAVFDVLTMMTVLSKHPQVWENMGKPKVRLTALVSKEDRQLAKDEGFTWRPTIKKWQKECVAQDSYNFAFNVVVEEL